MRQYEPYIQIIIIIENKKIKTKKEQMGEKGSEL